ncbi:aldo/keto reductase [Hyperthermus butylicus]|uniref:Aldo/keto reductase n=1 Tax=Hyperthermus butylicus (strain DSM 5456 / JCM 9403 / PLM1-5) TaxID=415426 RepID=A2BKZ0_HYPBU|nr:aldo/keto reductase [Hyperthermus butylicus]ABM80651.1 putative Aldo/keto reductase [Hyperthermus butylicus DSM 5456]
MPRYSIDNSDWKLIGKDRVSAIGLGTWAIRRPEAAYQVMLAAIESGKVNLIDTAEMYGAGFAEKLVGRVVSSVGRDRVFITTKMLPERLVSEEEIEKAARASVRRLGVGMVDLFLIHWPNYQLPISVQVRRFERIIYGRYARYIGVSNFGPEELLEAIHATSRAEIVVNQVHYSILHKRHVEEELLPIALKYGVTIQAYTPLERGAVAKHPKLLELSRKLGKTAIQIALNYLISRPRVIAIPKTENMDHLREILGALGWRLTEDILEELEKL